MQDWSACRAWGGALLVLDEGPFGVAGYGQFWSESAHVAGHGEKLERPRWDERALSVVALRYTIDVPDVVHELLVAELALEKLGARSISAVEAEQMLRNPHVTVRNPHGGDGLDTRRLMIGLTDGGRFLTLVIRAD